MAPLLDPHYIDATRRSISSTSSSTPHWHNSILSSSELRVDDDYEFSIPLAGSKPLPLLPSSDSDEFDPYLIEHKVSHPSQSPIPVLTTTSQLAYALGPDNTPHTTEIDTLPCAGIHILHGALTGLLAWRLVVRLVPKKEIPEWWDHYTDRRNSYSAPTVHTQLYKGAPIPYHPFASISALSLPLFTPALSPGTGCFHNSGQKVLPSSVVLTRQPHSSETHLRTMSRIQRQPRLGQNSPPLSNALVVNFILDTSLPYSIISRDTLIALGYPLSSILCLENALPMVTLSIQNIHTRFHIAGRNEASRLGVQFLHDAGVSVFFPKNGQGVGPVLYVESAHLLKDVPRTIALQKLGVKLTLPQRVRALFGFRDPIGN